MKADEALKGRSLRLIPEVKQLDFRLLCERHRDFFSDDESGVWYFWKEKVGPGNIERVFYWGSMQQSSEANFFLISEKNSYLHWNITGRLGEKKAYRNYVFYEGNCRDHIDRMASVYDGNDISVEVASGILLIIFYVEPFDERSIDRFIQITKDIGSIFGEKSEK